MNLVGFEKIADALTLRNRRMNKKTEPVKVDRWNHPAYLFYPIGNLAQAAKALRKMLTPGEAQQNKREQAMTLGNLGNVYATRGERDRAEDILGKALALNRALGNRNGMAANYANLGRVYEQRGNPAQAEALWKKSLSLYEATGHPYAEMIQQWLDDLPRPAPSTDNPR